MNFLSFTLLISIVLTFSQNNRQDSQNKENHQELHFSSCSFGTLDTWPISQQKGALHGRILASTHTLEENNFVKSPFYKTNNRAVRIGGHEHLVIKAKSRRWRWVDKYQMACRDRLLWSLFSTKSHFLFFLIFLYLLVPLYCQSLFCLI